MDSFRRSQAKRHPTVEAQERTKRTRYTGRLADLTAVEFRALIYDQLGYRSLSAIAARMKYPRRQLRYHLSTNESFQAPPQSLVDDLVAAGPQQSD